MGLLPWGNKKQAQTNNEEIMGTVAQNEPQSKSIAVYNELDVERQRFMPALTLELACERRQLIVEATAKLMQEGVDFGKIPGCERPTLLQPGADKLCNLFGLTIRYELIEQVEDWSGQAHEGEPFFYYKVRARAYRGDYLMGEGIGSCNSWESKYRWRKAERKCPACGRDNLRSSKQEAGGWYCWPKTGGCGATYPTGAAGIETQQVGRVLNADIFDQVNTLQKIAHKRAKQDLEDQPTAPKRQPAATGASVNEPLERVGRSPTAVDRSGRPGRRAELLIARS